MVRVIHLTIVGLAFVFAAMALSSTAAAQYIHIRGPFGGGFQFRAPYTYVPRPMPPFIPGPMRAMPIPQPPVFAVAPYQYGVRRAPVYGYGYQSFRLNYASPAGYGSVVVTPPMDRSSRETLGRVPVAPQGANVATQLRQQAARLHQSLAYRRDGEIWINYLAPNRIVAAIDQNNPAALRDLINHYDGVTANPQLAWLTRLDGFAETRSLLASYLDLPALPQPERVIAPGAGISGGRSVLEQEAPLSQPPAANPLPAADRPAADPPAADPPADPVDEEVLPVPDAKVDGPTPAAPIKSADEPTSV